ncbi:MAG: exopolysaccharide biosynthesis protein [Deltaproteobacteria bacterium]|nr:exopolysaccharide biosynthesis protein [Deltaproteobacteria bacterium]
MSEREESEKLSAQFAAIARSLPDEKLPVQDLLERVGQSGMLLFAVFLTLPFLVPVSVPGVSTVFGLLIILIGIGFALDRLPWLPSFVMKRTVPAGKLGTALEQGSKLVARIEGFLHPRLGFLVHGLGVNRLNGLALAFAGVLLMAPFGFVPFSNTVPGLAILFLALGMLERDGVFVILGYLMTVATCVYFGVLIWGAYQAGSLMLGG